MPLKFAALNLTEAPESEPLTLAEVKLQLRIDSDVEDAYLTLLITAAREWAEDYTGRAFLTQSWVAQFTGWPDDRIFQLPRPNLLSVESVKYIDGDDEEVTVDAEDYYVDTVSRPGNVMMTKLFGIPGLSENRVNAISIEFTAGYTDDAEELAPRIKQALLLAIADWYENRVQADNAKQKVPAACAILLNQIRIRPV